MVVWLQQSSRPRGGVRELASHRGAVGKGEGGAGILVSDETVGSSRRGRTSRGEKSLRSDLVLLRSGVRGVLELGHRGAPKWLHWPGERSWLAGAVQGDHGPQFLSLQKSEEVDSVICPTPYYLTN